MSKKLGILLCQRILRLSKDAHEGCFVQLIQRSDNRQPPNKLGNQTELQQSSGWTSCRSSVALLPSLSSKAHRKPHPLTSSPLANDVLKPDKRAAADEKDIGRVHLKELLLRVFSATLQAHWPSFLQ